MNDLLYLLPLPSEEKHIAFYKGKMFVVVLRESQGAFIEVKQPIARWNNAQGSCDTDDGSRTSNFGDNLDLEAFLEGNVANCASIAARKL